MSESHQPTSDKLYLVVFACLAVLTGMSFLVSEDASYVTAQVISVSGGMA